MSLSVALRRLPAGPAGMGQPRSVIDLEAVPIGGLGGQRLLVQAGDGGARRPLPQPRLELLDFLPLTGDPDLDRAVPPAPPPAHQPPPARHAAPRGAAAHPPDP